MKILTQTAVAFAVLTVTGCAGLGHSANQTLHSKDVSISVENTTLIDQRNDTVIETVAYFGLDDDLNHDVLAVEELDLDSGDSSSADQPSNRNSGQRDGANDEQKAKKNESFGLQGLQPYTLKPETSLGELIPAAEGNAYTLADIETIALDSNPAIQAAQATISKAAGLRHQVGTRPNPTLGYFGQQIADRNTDQHGIFVEQEFVRGNKLQLNREVLSHTQRAQSAENEMQRYRVLTDVRVRFFETIAAQQQVDATRSFADVARRGVQVAEERREAEEGTLIETLQAQTLLSEVTLAAEQAEVAYRGAWRDLAAIAGMQAEVPARLISELTVPIESPDWKSAYPEILSQSPELAAARAVVCEKQALLRRQKAQPISNVTAQLGAGYDDSTDNGMINVQLSAPIPVWNKNQGSISAAYADYVRATQQVQRIQRSIQARLARAAQDFDSALASVRKYDSEIIPQAKRSLELSEEAYGAGELDFLQVLIVRRSFYESSIRLISAKGKLAQAAAKVDGLLLTGGLDSPTDYTDGDGLRGASLGGQ